LTRYDVQSGLPAQEIAARGIEAGGQNFEFSDGPSGSLGRRPATELVAYRRPDPHTCNFGGGMCDGMNTTAWPQTLPVFLRNAISDTPDYPRARRKTVNAKHTTNHQQQDHSWNVIRNCGARHANTRQKWRHITLRKIRKSSHGFIHPCIKPSTQSAHPDAVCRALSSEDHNSTTHGARESFALISIFLAETEVFGPGH